MQTNTRIATLREQAANLLAEAERLENLPVDNFELGAVVTWTRQFDLCGPTYTYAAVKFAAGYGGTTERWALTGRTARFLSWDQLYDMHLSQADAGSLYWASELTPMEDEFIEYKATRAKMGL